MTKTIGCDSGAALGITSYSGQSAE
jgi:hypothetical protein